jgi:hypothetical protein
LRWSAKPFSKVACVGDGGADSDEADFRNWVLQKKKGNKEEKRDLVSIK